MNIEELLNVEQIQEQVIESATSSILESCRNQIVAEVSKRVQSEIGLTVSKTVMDALNQQYQPLTEWGEANGDPTTLREAFFKATKDWWNEKVNDKGEPDRYYNAKTRASWAAHQAVAEALRGQLAGELNKIVSSAKDELKQAIASTIADAVAKF